jgi:hypothetical protein
MEHGVRCVEQVWGICLVTPSAAGESGVFRFVDFIAALALLLIVYTVTDVRYRFRLAIAPTIFHLHLETFVLIGIIGSGSLFTDVWVAEKWLVPESLIPQPVWRGILAMLFLALVMTWMWYAFLRPPVFGRRNYRRYANALYTSVVKGSIEELPVIANELGRSAAMLVKHARLDPLPNWGPQDADESSKRKRKATISDIAHDVLLLMGNRKLCRYIVESSPITAIAFFEEAVKHHRTGIPLGQFAKSVSTEAIINKDSNLYHEDDGFSTGLLGYLKPFSHAVYGNYPLVENLGARFGSPLDIGYANRSPWDADQLEAYCRATLLTVENYLATGYWGRHSFTIHRAFDSVRAATHDVYKLNKAEDNFYPSDIAQRLERAVEFIKRGVDLLGREVPVPVAQLRVKDNREQTLYDTLAKSMVEIIKQASAVTEPIDTCWTIQHNMVWDEWFGIDSRGEAWDIVLFKLRRRLYDYVLRMDKFQDFSSARLLGYCLNVMGLVVWQRAEYGKDFRALHRAILAWTQRNYLRLVKLNPELANRCLTGGISYDRDGLRLVKTYAKGFGQEPHREYLDLQSSDNNEP